jgi:hypothetical protein
MAIPTDISSQIAQIIRARSKTVQLIEAEEIRTELAGHGISEAANGDQAILSETWPKTVLEEHPDLKEISGGHGRVFYHSVESLSESYAAILVWKSEDPLRLIAHVVRENARVYPRPVSMDSFQSPPFSLSEEVVAGCLATMAQHDEYSDIAQTVTSIGNPYLFSTQYLDPDHASMLAEWLDVGQSANP